MRLAYKTIRQLDAIREELEDEGYTLTWEIEPNEERLAEMRAITELGVKIGRAFAQAMREAGTYK